ncbi:MAG: hypothetical protein AAFR61_08970 [Bacteroidota bacterium]
MTGEEKRRILKEQYKRDLQKRKEFLEDVKKLRHTQKLNKAVSEITEGLTKDDSEDWIRQLNEEAAVSEAKFEMFMDDQTTEDVLEKAVKEEEAKKFSAEEMVRQMKREMGLLPPEEEKPAAKPEAQEEATAETTEETEAKQEDSTASDQDDQPRKQLGDF